MVCTYEILQYYYYCRIYKQGEQLATADTPHILSCTDMRQFYLHWSYGHIEVRYGSHSGKIAVDYHAEADWEEIHSVSLWSEGQADWVVSRKAGQKPYQYLACINCIEIV